LTGNPSTSTKTQSIDTQNSYGSGFMGIHFIFLPNKKTYPKTRASTLQLLDIKTFCCVL